MFDASAGDSPGPDAPPPGMSVELGPLVIRLSTSLGCEVPVGRIEQVLRDLLEQEFSEARVTAFLPVFLHRYAIETLRREHGGGGSGVQGWLADGGRSHA